MCEGVEVSVWGLGFVVLVQGLEVEATAGWLVAGQLGQDEPASG